MTLYKWSQTAASNATADSTVNWAEGQAPSSVNDSSRAAMAAVAKYRDDNAGSLTTGGTSTAYTLTSNQVFSSLSTMSGQAVVFKVHATSGASPTLNVDGLGARALHSVGGTVIPTGSLVANGVYAATFDNSNSRWVVHGYYGFQPLDATLTALAAVTTAADKLIYATGADAFSTNDLTSVARTLIAQTTQALMRSTGLGLGTAAVEATGTSGDAFGKLNANKTDSGTNTFSGANTFSNAAGIAARNTVKAFGHCTGTLQAGSLNVASIVDGGTSHTISFTTPMSDANYTIIVTSGNSGTDTIVHYNEGSTLAGSFVVSGVDASSGATIDPGNYMFMVLSNQ